MAKRIHNIWQATNEKDDESEMAFQRHLQRMKEADIEFPSSSSKKFFLPNKRFFSFSIAAFLLLSVSATIWFNQNEKTATPPIEKKYSEVSSPIGSKTKLILPDSTVVWLNAGSKLTYNEQFGVSNRNTVLIGEAFFDVKKSAIPFTIRANAVQIKVLGTAFNVRAYPDEKTTETSLIRGRVEITIDKKPGRQFVLEPNEKLIVANEPEEIKKKLLNQDALVVLKALTRTNDSTVAETSWVNNEFIFQDESFGEIAKRMEKWFGVAIEFTDEKLANERLSGTFTSETIQDALNAMQYSTKFHYSTKGNLIIITR